CFEDGSIGRPIGRKVTRLFKKLLKRRRHQDEGAVDFTAEYFGKTGAAIRGFKIKGKPRMAGKKGFRRKLELRRDGSSRNAIEQVVFADAADCRVFFERILKTEDGVDAFIAAGREAGFGASELFHGLIVDEEAERAFRSFILCTTHLQMNGGGFAWPVGFLNRCDVQFKNGRFGKDNECSGRLRRPIVVAVDFGVRKISDQRNFAYKLFVGRKRNLRGAPWQPEFPRGKDRLRIDANKVNANVRF